MAKAEKVKEKKISRRRVALLTGSDAPTREDILRQAEGLINSCIGPIERSSQIMQSEPWGFAGHNPFANQAVVALTALSPEEVLRQALDIEQRLGRDRKAEQQEKTSTGERYASRVVDIDVIFYEDAVVESEHLRLPHPLMHRREFVLRPLCEVAPDWLHPVMGKSVRELLEGLEGA